MTFITEQAQVDWLVKVGNFEVGAVEFAPIDKVKEAQAVLKERLASMNDVFPAEFIAACPGVNSYGHNMAKLDNLAAELVYYINEVAQADTSFEIAEAGANFEYIFDDFYPAVEAAGLATDHLDDLEYADI